MTVRYLHDDGRVVFPETKVKIQAGLKVAIVLPGTVYQLTVEPYRAEACSLAPAEASLTINGNVRLLSVKIPYAPTEVTVYYRDK